jgi:hypothetical protein
MDAKLLASIAGIVLSLLFTYLPGLKDWYEPLDSAKKSLIMLGLIIIVAAAVFGLSCAGWYKLVSCDQIGIKGLVEAVILVLVSNQATFLISPKPGE